MAMMNSQGWNSPGHGLHPAPEDDFQQFLDMNSIGNLGDGLQFDFQDYQNANGHQPIMGGAPPPRETIDTPMTGTDGQVLLSQMDPAMHAQMPMSTATSHPSITSTMLPPSHSPGDAISEIDAQIQYLQQQKLQQQQRQLEEQQAAYYVRQSRMVPPTPQSLEIQAGNNQFYVPPDHTPHQHGGMYESYQRLKDQHDMAFTPLVSPAVTPLESHFPVDTQFTVPGAYFSPLTSPALHAQNESMAVFDHRISAANTSSPDEMDLEAVPPSLPAPSLSDVSKKTRKGNSTKSRGKGSVRQSPISKPQRKKTGSTPLLNGQVLSGLAEGVEQPQDQSSKPIQHPAQPKGQTPVSMGTTDSENGSVSPENLSEMPPPPLPKPRSAKPSPYMQPQNSAAPAAPHVSLPGKPSPATPASLMKLTSPNANKALRPKISPNIKPLLPGGSNAEDTASRLLASKSNYQNILEGNTVPGVSYPSELSTNLTSKRTSHKIAEQGRRNRINSALQEIATLLPNLPGVESKGSEGDSDKKDKSGNAPNSKASTVEMAIEYIKQLRQEVAEANKRAEEAEKKLATSATTKETA
ncbi:putative phosphorus acquisition-controlling protein [Phaeoacremonium minimum UCRPA7]|uniref:Putative phosphorus acquisition-controlling protein n=1 Tax=Phaeoacremonium minimum (strain UCR-PA7) TaxID=1286976 RepID=R8BMR4_PHAM7|nr:putative phosphorus acquisition-controlling protein [Phaeoacremonium minimum UCRPA7]EOO00560.1 putative phosphorus acquisition-controlling protein [Phaeoacremonium minimum UCRPA7]